MLKSVELKRERLEVTRRLEAINDKSAGRDLLASEQRDWDRLETRTHDLDDEILRAEEHEASERASIVPFTGPGGSSLNHRDLEDDVLAQGDSVVEWARRRGLVTGEEPSLGQIVAASAIFAAQEEKVGSSGGFLLPEFVSAELLDLARAKSVMIQAGAQMRMVDQPLTRWPTLDGDPSASWVDESKTLPETSFTFGALEMRARKVIALVKVSRELFEDVPSLDAEFRRVLTDVLALAIDLAGLYGNQITQPAGIRGWEGVSVTTLGSGNGAAPTSFDQLVDTITAIRGQNYEPSAAVWAPRTGGTYSKLKDTTNQPLQAPADVEALPKLATTQAPTNLVVGSSSDCSEIFLGEFEQYLYVAKLATELTILRERYVDNDQIGVLARARIDGSPLRGGAFGVIAGVRP